MVLPRTSIVLLYRLPGGLTAAHFVSLAVQNPSVAVSKTFELGVHPHRKAARLQLQHANTWCLTACPAKGQATWQKINTENTERRQEFARPLYLQSRGPLPLEQPSEQPSSGEKEGMKGKHRAAARWRSPITPVASLHSTRFVTGELQFIPMLLQAEQLQTLFGTFSWATQQNWKTPCISFFSVGRKGLTLVIAI